MTDTYEEQKVSSGSLATVVFIVTALYLFTSYLGFSSLISLNALGFFVSGMFVAAILIGIPAYLLQRVMGKVIMKTLTDPFSEASIKKIKMMGVFLLLVQIAVTIIITNMAFKWFIL